MKKAFENTAALVREIMRETGIPLERVYRHYDICSKYCPSQIMNRGDWDRMKRMIGSGAGSTGTGTAGSGTGKRMRPGSIRCRQRPSTSVQAPDADSRMEKSVSSPSAMVKKAAEVVQPEIEKRILKDPVLCYTGR